MSCPLSVKTEVSERVESEIRSYCQSVLLSVCTFALISVLLPYVVAQNLPSSHVVVLCSNLQCFTAHRLVAINFLNVFTVGNVSTLCFKKIHPLLECAIIFFDRKSMLIVFG